MSKNKRTGRPPSGEDGSMVSEYPKLTITMKADTKARLEALRSITREPAWKIIDLALEEYFRSLPQKDRKTVETVSKSLGKTRILIRSLEE